MSTESSSSFINRIIRAMMLDVSLYEEVESDVGALGQAMGVVVWASVAAGVGNIFNGGVWGVIGGTIAALVGWVIWAAITYVVGVKMLPEAQTQSSMGELLRTIGFASAPGLFSFLTFLPIVGGLIGFAIGIWMLIAMVIAVRQALDYQSTGRAVAVCLIGWVVKMAITVAFFIFSATIMAFVGVVSG